MTKTKNNVLPLENGFKSDFIFKANSLIENTMFDKETFEHTLVSGCVLSSVTLNFTVFDSCVFFASQLECCNFHRCKFINCNFQFSCFDQCSFNASEFENCRWESSQIKRTTTGDCMANKIEKSIAA